MLAEKIATAINLGPANTRIRNYADIYTLTGDRTLSHTAARDALIATATHRGTNIVALSSVIGNLVELRTRSHYGYRTGLGPEADTLPKEFTIVVQTVLAFADPLADTAPPTTIWNGKTRTWIN